MIPKEDLQKLSDAELVKLVSEKDDSRALGMLMENHRSFLKMIVHGYLPNTLYHEDVILKVWIKVRKTLLQKGYKDESHFESWLGRIAKNECLDEIKKNKNMELVSFTEDDGTELIADDALNPEEELEMKEEEAAIKEKAAAELAKLTPHERKVVKARIMDELSIKESAVALRLKEDTISRTLSRARSRLKVKRRKK